MKTFYGEMSFVALALVIVALLSGKGSVEWFGAAAVLCSFGHVNVTSRMAEHIAYYEKTTGVAVVSCYRWERYYFLLKEIFWLIYFIKLGAYSALVAVVIFLLYPLWRKLWRKYHPYQPETN